MSSRLVTLEKDRGVATVRMRDEKGRNSLSDSLVAELRSRLDQSVADPSCRVVLLCGLPDVFCSGAPLVLLEHLTSEQLKPTELDLPRDVLSLPLPCVAAMRGHAVGGGLAIGLAADVAVFARESRYAANFTALGFTPGMGMTRLLEHVLPPTAAAEMLFTGGSYRGTFFGGVSGPNRVVAERDTESVALDIALQIAENPRHTLELLKRTLGARRRQLYEADLHTESLMHEICFARPQIRDRILRNYGPLSDE